jgi:N-acetylglucosamine kinase-like BadF-type ATPase
MSYRYLAAVDMGGTKAEGVVFREDGEIVFRVVEKGGAPFDNGVEYSITNLCKCIDGLIAGAPEMPAALYVGAAACEYYMSEFTGALARYGFDHLRIEGDGPSLVSGIFGHADGAGMICGTGSSLYVRKGDEYYHIGGGGHMIDSCGSGYVLGRKAIRAALRAVDGSDQPTMLVEMLEEAAGFPLWYRLDQIYTRGRSYVASFAHVLFEARNKGDIVARRIFNECASDLADVIWAQYKKNGGPYDLIFNGGIFRNYPEYADAVKAMAPKDMRIFFAEVSPIYGGAVEALYDIGIRADESFREKFMKSYEAIKNA